MAAPFSSLHSFYDFVASHGGTIPGFVPNVRPGDARGLSALHEKLDAGLTLDAIATAVRTGEPLHVIVEYVVPAREGFRTGSGDGMTVRSAAAPDVARRVAALVDEGGDVQRISRALPFVEAKVTPKQLTDLAASPDVVRVYAVREVHALLDTGRENTLGTTGPAFDAAFGLTGAGVRIAVLDTGIDGNHPDFQGRITAWKDFVGNADGVRMDTPYDDQGHGTHVASIAAGSGAASEGRYRGVAPEATLFGAKVLSASGGGSDAGIIEAIEWAVDPNGDEDRADGAHIISMSLGGPCSPHPCDGSDPLSSAVDWAVEQGVIVIVAAGNSGPSAHTVDSPGSTKRGITVGAWADQDAAGWGVAAGDIAPFSSRGPTSDYRVKPEVLAPGVAIMAAEANTGGYVAHSGTSMATPMVSGLAALLLERHPALSPDEVKSRLASTATPIGDLPVFDQGLGKVVGVDALNASFVFGNVTTDLGAFYVGDSPVDRALAIPVTNVGDHADSFTFTLGSAPAGVTATVTSATTLDLAPGASGTLTVQVTFNPDDVTGGAYSVNVTGANATSTIRHAISFVKLDYVPLTPFAAYSDADLDALAADPDGPFVAGDGSAGNPFVVRDVTGSGVSGTIVTLSGTTRHILFERVGFTETMGPAVRLENVQNVTFDDASFKGNGYGLFMNGEGAGVTINNTDFGMNGLGLLLNGTSGVTVSNSTIAQNQRGAFVVYGSGNRWLDNAFTLNTQGGGLAIALSTNEVLRGNAFDANLIGWTYNMNLDVVGTNGHHYDHDIDTSNLVNAYPVYYQYGGESFVLDGGADTTPDFGNIFLVNVSHVELTNLLGWWHNDALGGIVGADTVMIANADNVLVDNVSLEYGFGYALLGSRDARVTNVHTQYGNLLGMIVMGMYEGTPSHGSDAEPPVPDYPASRIRVDNVTLANGLAGFVALLAENVTLENASVAGNRFVGLFAYDTDNLTVQDSTVGLTGAQDPQSGDFHPGVGATLYASTGTRFIRNTFTDRMETGLSLVDAADSQIRGNHFGADVTDAVSLMYGTSDTIVGNVVTGAGNGVRVSGSSDTTVAQNTLTHVSGEALRIQGAIMAEVSGNAVTGSGTALLVQDTWDSVVTGNDLQGNKVGLFLANVTATLVDGNVMADNGQFPSWGRPQYKNLVVTTDTSREWLPGNAVTGNTVQGLPVEYYEGATGTRSGISGTVPVFVAAEDLVIEAPQVAGADALMIVGGRNVTVNDAVLVDTNGIDAWGVNGLSVEAPAARNLSSGVRVEHSMNVNVANGTFETSDHPVQVRYTGGFRIEHNAFNDSHGAVYLLDGSNNGHVTRNRVANATDGVVLAGPEGRPPHDIVIDFNLFENNGAHVWLGEGTWNNLVTANNFLGLSSYVANDDGDAGANRWSGDALGNHWADHTTPDENGDGIVDTPRTILGVAGSKDHFPSVAMVEPGDWHTPPPPSEPVLHLDITLTDGSVTQGETIAFSGTVTNETHEPQEGATVKVFFLGGSVESFATDVNGQFAATLETTDLVGDFIVAVVAEKNGLNASATRQMLVTSSGGTPGTPFSVFGTVTYKETSASAAGAGAIVKNTANGKAIGAITDESGGYIVDLSGLGYSDGDVILVTAGDTDGLTGRNTGVIPSSGDMLEINVALSDVQEAVIGLVTGWNLIGLPLTTQAALMATDIMDATGATAVSRYDPATGGFQTVLRTSSGQTFGTDFELEPGVGYFVKVPDAATLTVTGQPVAGVTYELLAGWNLLAYPFADGAKAGALMEQDTLNATSVSRYDTATGSFQTYLRTSSGNRFGTNFELEPGFGYFVKVPEDVTYAR